MLESRERYLQYLAALRFYEEATGDFTFYQEEPASFTEDELREEAAFRCWLRELHAYPASLPPSATLLVMADAYDWEYGEYVWWTWPIWSSCDVCRETPVMCAECCSYARFCTISEGWAPGLVARSRL